MNSIRLLNVADGEVLPHRMALVHGVAVGCHRIQVRVRGEHVGDSKVVHDRFKTVFMLEDGHNAVDLVGQVIQENDDRSELYDADHLSFTVFHKPILGRREVRLHYLMTTDSDGTFQAPPGEPNDQYTGMMRMIQLATAEMLRAWFPDHPRTTFKISDDVYETVLPLTKAEAWEKDGHALWGLVNRNLSLRNPDLINLGVMSFSKWNGEKALAHTALGGNCTALFGGASMFTWPTDVNEIESRFLDNRDIDRSVSFKDGPRQGRWGSASTTIGACLHELGHCLNLPHPGGRLKNLGIMARGFDFLNRVFVLEENGRPLQLGEVEAYFDRGSACRLLYHPFLTQREPRNCPKMYIERGTEDVIVTADDGIRQVAFFVNSENCGHKEFALIDNPPKMVRLANKDALRDEYDIKKTNHKMKISVVDSNGYIFGLFLKDIPLQRS
ncbi:hypothetical protein NDN08_001258 [Rhodosorus marinus]|uniref:Zinc metalloproteinase n=1 Tax=Rhodosorus marinus TaxID=101924 RepID=A0AAV8UTZ1_9RHOD|nr:hypothetical protein NDN08_001258 [Rhodosorus marinus]